MCEQGQEWRSPSGLAPAAMRTALRSGSQAEGLRGVCRRGRGGQAVDGAPSSGIARGEPGLQVCTLVHTAQRQCTHAVHTSLRSVTPLPF